jgi:hypothetical protein
LCSSCGIHQWQVLRQMKPAAALAASAKKVQDLKKAAS